MILNLKLLIAFNTDKAVTLQYIVWLGCSIIKIITDLLKITYGLAKFMH